MKQRREWLVLSVGGLILLGGGLLLSPVRAGGPLFINSRGQPFHWPRNPVTYTPDRGPLGILDNAAAVELVADALSLWQEVETATIAFEQRGQLDVDVTGTNVMDVLSRLRRDLNPILFDHDGSIIEALAGTGASRDIVGFGSPTLRPPGVTRGEFRQGWAVFNGLFVGQRIPLKMFRATVVHEFGHFIGLDHTQVNLREALDGLPINDRGIPTMFPLLISRHQARLHADDIAALSAIYPDPRFATSTGTIQGRVLMPNGVAGFQGANVVARRVSGVPLAISAISGDQFIGNRRPRGGNGVFDPRLRGFYRIVGLPPGRYTVEVEPIHPAFTGGSGLGPLDPPPPLVGGREFYSGAMESNDDGPRRIALVPVEAGAVVEDADIILNGQFPENDLCAQATRITGTPFVDRLDTRSAATEDDDPVHTCTASIDAGSVWYRFLPESSGVAIVDTLGSSYDTVLSAYTGRCGDLVEIACNDAFNEQIPQSQIVFGALAGEEILIEVSRAGNLPGGGDLRFSFQFFPDVLVAEQEPNETIEQAQRLSSPGAVLGDIGPGDEGIISVPLNGRQERVEDVFTFSLDGSAIVQVNLTPQRMDVNLDLVLFVVEDATPRVIAQSSPVGISKDIGPVELPAGTYNIGVSLSDRHPGRQRTTYILAIASSGDR